MLTFTERMTNQHAEATRLIMNAQGHEYTTSPKMKRGHFGLTPNEVTGMLLWTWPEGRKKAKK